MSRNGFVAFIISRLFGGGGGVCLLSIHSISIRNEIEDFSRRSQ